MNYEQTIADIRAEIARLEREHGASRAYVATFRLLKAMELLAEANRLIIRLASKAAWDKAAAMPTLSTITITEARRIAIAASADADTELRLDREREARRK